MELPSGAAACREEGDMSAALRLHTYAAARKPRVSRGTQPVTTTRVLPVIWREAIRLAARGVSQPVTWRTTYLDDVVL